MKKHIKLITGCIVFFAAMLILMLLLPSDCFVADRSAEVYSESVCWGGNDYYPISGKYTEGQTIAKSPDGNWKIKEVAEDPTHTFIVARSFLDQYLFVLADYTVPESGQLTSACWNGEYITDPRFLSAVAKLDAEKTASFTYETEGIFMLTETQHMRDLYFAYENCPVATNFKGYMGKVNGEWVITTYISPDTRNEDGSPKPYTVSCYLIPDEYTSILEKFFS